MKLPRWLILTMLVVSVAAVLAAAGWWWVSWPERTAREFVERIAAGEFRGAAEMLDPRPDCSFYVIVDVPAGEEQPIWLNSRLRPLPRSFVDVVYARRDFHMDGMGAEFTVEKNKILKGQSFAYLPFFEIDQSGFGERGRHEIWRILIRSKVLPQVP